MQVLTEQKTNSVLPHGVSEEARHWLLTAGPWVQSQETLCEIHGAWGGNEADFLIASPIHPANRHSAIAPYSTIMPSEVCDSSDQGIHCHISLGIFVEAFTSDPALDQLQQNKENTY